MDLPCEDTTCEFRVALPIIPNDVMNKRLNGQLPRGQALPHRFFDISLLSSFLCKMNYSVESMQTFYEYYFTTSLVYFQYTLEKFAEKMLYEILGAKICKVTILKNLEKRSCKTR